VILNADARRLPIADASVDCIIASPPYNAGIDYGEVSDILPWDEYRDLAARAALETYRTLRENRRCWVNIVPSVPTVPRGPKGPADAGWHSGRTRAPRVNLLSLWSNALEQAGFEYQDTVSWPSPGRGGQTAWGSWKTPSAPNLRGEWEAVLIFSKGSWARETPPAWHGWKDPDRWDPLVSNVWKMQTAQRNGHPAPFPEQLAARAIRLSTWPGEVVLDPFSGEGTTVKAAERLGRMGIGTDLSAAYCELAQARNAQGVLL
jgi:site-specific DNA-methyltransferase (adenine-specific)